MPSLTATILIPTSGDRAELVRLSLGCILRQTIQDFEVFIVGDGVTALSRDKLREFEKEDPRVKFFDHPKHASRGEPYRHEALQEARGRIVCYSCDRDLWLPHHLETLDEALQEVDFANTLEFMVMTDGSIVSARMLDLSQRRHRMAMNPRMRHFDPFVAPGLSCTGHTLEAYKRLPEGWTETPPRHISDCYMWRKFARHPDIRAKTVARPTLLYFSRERFPGWPVEKRLAELGPWADRVENDPGLYASLLESTMDWLYFERSRLMDTPAQRFKRFRESYLAKSAQFFKRLKETGLREEIRRRTGKKYH